MIRELKELFDNIIVSTGASYDNEIKLTSKILKIRNSHYYIVLQFIQHP